MLVHFRLMYINVSILLGHIDMCILFWYIFVFVLFIYFITDSYTFVSVEIWHDFVIIKLLRQSFCPIHFRLFLLAFSNVSSLK